MKLYKVNKIIIALTVLLVSLQANAQLIPEDYFQPKAGGTPESDFYALVSYDIGMLFNELDVANDLIGSEGFNAKVFFPGNSNKGYALSLNYNKMVQYTYIDPLLFNDYYSAAILSKNIDFQAKSIGSSGWGFGLFYQRKSYVLGGVNYYFNGLGLEISAGGYPDLNYEKGNWPVSFKTGIVLQTESFEYEEPGTILYSELALERIRKKQGVSLYGALYTRFQFESYKFMAEGADESIDTPIFEFDTYSLIPGFRFGILF